jgi:hypothetical protein
VTAAVPIVSPVAPASGARAAAGRLLPLQLAANRAAGVLRVVHVDVVGRRVGEDVGDLLAGRERRGAVGQDLALGQAVRGVAVERAREVDDDAAVRAGRALVMCAAMPGSTNWIFLTSRT